MLNENQEKLNELIHAGEFSKIQGLLEDMHPADIAECLEEGELSDEELLAFFHDSDKEFLASVLEEADDALQAKIVKLLSYPEVIRIFSFMSNDDIVDILGNLPIDLRKRLLNTMKTSDSRELAVLLGYDEETAGGIMTTEYIALRENLTMEQALLKIKQIAPRTEVIETIFILNVRRELVGLADLRDILVAPNQDTLSTIMDDNVISVYPEQDQEAVARTFTDYSLTVLPVINHKGGLLGIITADDVMDVMIEEQTEDILRMGGVSDDETIESPPLVSVKKRLPWLCVNLITAYIASFTISMFDSIIAQVAALASSMTIVSGMGGNAGTQILSVVIRGITLGEVDLKSDWKYVLKEVAVGLIDGAAIGTITAGFMIVRYHNPWLAIIIFLAMIGNLMVAGVAGFLIPQILKLLHQDPALGSGIFLTACTDTLGFFIFLGLATLFLPKLI